MANFDLSQLLGTPDAQAPPAGAMPQQPLVPQQFPIDNPILKAAQGLGGALQGNPNVQGGPPVSIQDMLPSIPRNKWEALMMLAGPALGMAAGKLGGAASKTLSIVDSGEKNPLGDVIYRLMRGKEKLPFFGTQDELYNVAQKMGQKVESVAQTVTKPTAQVATSINLNSLPNRLSEAQMAKAQQIIDASNRATPGGFQGIQDRLDNVRYEHGRFGTDESRQNAINELLHSVNSVYAKQILDAK